MGVMGSLLASVEVAVDFLFLFWSALAPQTDLWWKVYSQKTLRLTWSLQASRINIIHTVIECLERSVLVNADSTGNGL